jgi:adenylate cyclase
MVKKPTTVRFSDATRQKLDALVARYGTQSEALAVAIDRLYQEEAQSRVVEQQIAVLFADLRGFTAFSKGKPPERVFTVLNQYISLASEAIVGCRGTLTEYMGDAVMAVFDESFPQLNRALGAVRAALSIREAVAEYNADVADHDPLQFGIGVHVGPAVVGHLGPMGQKGYAAVGETVNLAYRLHSQAKGGQILISPAVYEEVEEMVIVEEAEPVVVLGQSVMSCTYALVGLR